MDESFGRKEKLKSKKLIEILFQKGKSVKSFPLRLIYLPIENKQHVQFQTGVSVPKRIVKTAVQRNRIKRLMREAYRKNKYLVTNASGTSYAFMILYMTPKEMGYEELFKAMEKLMGKFKEKETWEN
ncbi:ribonuclease P protein component [Zunongwangia sp. F260]|uniref:Ribonuclease P protein component n=2 Tax=Autumnicola TaxID=3160927 RepID=A0ABU3CLN2_9FLAO|nr:MULTISPECIES: ribonuclease P protein component [unclassified Zunongwangia]MDT0647252.1 ribonuclease P protein component [Zunongwangia sp. F260]MDT0685532.1 ribonuclease P protein component [Zunongwangia sp. F225]